MTSTAIHTEFPTDETIAAFVDGRLSDAERRRVMEHIAQCDDCRALVESAMDWTALETNARAENVRPFRRPLRTVAAAIAVAASVAFVVFGPVGDWVSARRGGVGGLVAAAESLEARKLEGRISGGFAHRPLERTMRGSDDGDGITAAVYDAAATALERAQASPTPERLHAAGISQLLLGDATGGAAELERAIVGATGAANVNEAIARSRDAALLADLAAAYVALASRGAREKLEPAIAAAETSLSLEETPEAAFNRALAIERLQGREAAREAWREYLRLDPSSPWAAEARSRD